MKQMKGGPPTFFLVLNEKVIGQYPVVHQHTGVFSVAKDKETSMSNVTCLVPLLENQYEYQ